MGLLRGIEVLSRFRWHRSINLWEGLDKGIQGQ